MQNAKRDELRLDTSAETAIPVQGGETPSARRTGKHSEPYAVDTANAALLLGVSKSHLEKLRLNDPENSPPFFRVGRAVRYSRRKLMEWAESNSIGCAE